MSKSQHTVKTNCKFCRREFESFNLKKVCSQCENDMEKNFQRIKEHITEFPDATVSEICLTLNLPSSLIKYYLKEERLEILQKSNNYFLKCELCNKPISYGHYCPECEKIAMRTEMQTRVVQNKENEKIENDIARFHASRSRRLKDR